MNGRRTIVGLCMLCALLASAFAAQSASAITGTTAFTCAKGQGTLRGEHCLSTGTAAAEYGHVAITEKTEVTGTNANTGNNTTEPALARLKMTVAGVPLELSASSVSAEGSMTNLLAAGGEHYVQGDGTVTFSGVKVTSPNFCKVFTDTEAKTKGEEGVVHTRALKATTEGQGDFLRAEAADGGALATFFIECEAGKQNPAIEGTWECTGALKGVPTGGTIVYTHAEVTTQNTLICKKAGLGGIKAGFDASMTLSGRKSGSGGFTPLAATTVTT